MVDLKKDFHNSKKNNEINNKREIEINNILKTARESISNYCINECKAKCCRYGKLILLNEKEVDFICGNNKEFYLNNNALKKTEDGNYTFNHSKFKCRHLTNDFKCDDWKNPNRPKVCYDFPIFYVQKKYIITSDICPAITNGLLNKYLEKLKKLGLKII